MAEANTYPFDGGVIYVIRPDTLLIEYSNEEKIEASQIEASQNLRKELIALLPKIVYHNYGIYTIVYH